MQGLGSPGPVPPAPAHLAGPAPTRPPVGSAPPRGVPRAQSGVGSHGSTLVKSYVAPDVRAFKREYCVWSLDKNTLCRYIKRWSNTQEREWHPDVARVLNGTLTFNGANAEQFNSAASMAETFLMAHLDFTGEKGERLQKRMEEARLNGALVPCNGPCVA